MTYSEKDRERRRRWGQAVKAVRRLARARKRWERAGESADLARAAAAECQASKRWLAFA